MRHVWIFVTVGLTVFLSGETVSFGEGELKTGRELFGGAKGDASLPACVFAFGGKHRERSVGRSVGLYRRG